MKRIYITLILLALTQPLLASSAEADKLFRLASDLFSQRQYQKAGTAFGRYLEEYPFELDVKEALFYLGESQRLEKNYAQAIASYNRLLSRYPHSRYARELVYLQGECYYYLNLYQKSRSFLLDYLNQEKRPETRPAIVTQAYFYLGEMSASDIDRAGAAAYFEKSLQFASLPDNQLGANQEFMRNLHYRLGMLYSERKEKHMLAYQYLKQAVAEGLELTPTIKFAMKKLAFHHFDTDNGLPDNSVSDIMVDGDDVWISTWNGGMVRYTRSLETFEQISLPSNQLRNIYVDFGRVYITSFDGIYIYNKKNSQTYRVKSDNAGLTLAQKVVKDDRYVYFSTLSNGVARFDSVRSTLEVFAGDTFLKTGQIYSMDANYRFLAFGTLEKGVVLVDKEKKEIHYISADYGSLAGNNIKALLLDGRYLWIGEHLSGIYKYDLEERKIVLHDERIHFPSSIIRREKEIWVGTSGEGIRVYNQENTGIRNISALDGLSSNDIHLLRSEGDYVWIGYLDSGIDVIYSPVEIE